MVTSTPGNVNPFSFTTSRSKDPRGSSAGMADVSRVRVGHAATETFLVLNGDELLDLGYRARPRMDAGWPGSFKRLPVSVTFVPSTLRIETSLSV